MGDSQRQRELRSKARQEPPLFFNIKDYKRYIDDFSSRKILKGNFCDIPSIECVLFSQYFETLGWTSFINLKTPLYPRLVQGFTSVNNELSQWRAYMERFGPPPS